MGLIFFYPRNSYFLRRCSLLTAFEDATSFPNDHLFDLIFDFSIADMTVEWSRPQNFTDLGEKSWFTQ
jgi:hypothetical protein